MYAATPRLEILVDRIAGNARSLAEQCRASGVRVAAVTKVLNAHPALLEALAAAGLQEIADSRIDNLRRIAEMGHRGPRLLLRAPTPRTAAEAVHWADCSLNTSSRTVAALSRAAESVGVTHKVILMIDVGDLREGVWPDRAIAEAVAMSRMPHVELVGVGANLACYGGVLPSVDNMSRLVEIRDACREATGLDLPVVSGGNSANLALMASGQMPGEINHLRLGESIILGRNTLDREPWPGTRQDTVRVVGEVIEVGRKPSVPLGETGQDAFGRHPVFTDRGVRTRAICNLGRQDVVPENLAPTDPGIIVLGASSDHLILDVTDAGTPVDVGDEIAFWPGYSALLAASTSAHVHKRAVREP
ncbi:alanine/ornithine racemase family PLP-dependent enzyme [Propionibacterium australiense]|uniref:Alanine/ornithine racemase family PLP-dependent enzyme n=1 Tax=Propionibacterium australiense TaxID=119981 RepID=A0A383S582_9ACTN|nr:alanine/ornithine racemase family PLP-dependent enzyme [Propionibacterium australiense]RLP10078.1 alanine/ornithine racemase family PLP-dependent enzyme [Propionibacterium australiense]RLP11362.1 alanine/ornithine racemase family PLP-dependent enzyme [Propionibacterium australiense]SYZ33003.1 PLP-binding barrel [Propionibacterium australiense]VEH92263.1 Predicted amino acid aldolase or racemase [Propionibacterium australiense]